MEHVILSGVRSTKSKNLRTDPTENAIQVRRSFDSLPLAQDDKLVAAFDQFQLVELLGRIEEFAITGDDATMPRR